MTYSKDIQVRRSSYARWQRSGRATLPEYGLGRAQLDEHFAEYTRRYVRGAAWEHGVATQAQLRGAEARRSSAHEEGRALDRDRHQQYKTK